MVNTFCHTCGEASWPCDQDYTHATLAPKQGGGGGALHSCAGTAQQATATETQQHAHSCAVGHSCEDIAIGARPWRPRLKSGEANALPAAKATAPPAALMAGQSWARHADSCCGAAAATHKHTHAA